MSADWRVTSFHDAAVALFASVHRPGTQQVSDADELHVSPEGSRGVFTASVVETLEGNPRTCIGLVDLASGAIRQATLHSHNARSARFSPDGLRIAFLSDRQTPGCFQLWLLESGSDEPVPTPVVPGGVEY